MRRDLTHDQFVAALKRHGLKISDDDIGLVSFPHGGGGMMIGRFFSRGAKRRSLLAHVLQRLEEVERAHDRRMRIKAAWDAEFSQPIEPNFWRDSQAHGYGSVGEIDDRVNKGGQDGDV